MKISISLTPVEDIYCIELTEYDIKEKTWKKYSDIYLKKRRGKDRIELYWKSKDHRDNNVILSYCNGSWYMKIDVILNKEENKIEKIIPRIALEEIEKLKRELEIDKEWREMIESLEDFMKNNNITEILLLK